MRKPLKIQRRLATGVSNSKFIARGRPHQPRGVNRSVEHLVSCALIRDGVTHSGHRTHGDIRKNLGDERWWDPNPRDEYGFITNEDRFVDRFEARYIGYTANQCTHSGGQLLSCDINNW